MKAKTLIPAILIGLSAMGNAQTQIIKNSTKNGLKENLETGYKSNLEDSTGGTYRYEDGSAYLYDQQWAYADVPLTKNQLVQEMMQKYENKHNLENQDRSKATFNFIEAFSELQNLNTLSDGQIHDMVDEAISIMEENIVKWDNWLVRKMEWNGRKHDIAETLSSFIINNKDKIIGFGKWEVSQQELYKLLNQQINTEVIWKIKIDKETSEFWKEIDDWSFYIVLWLLAGSIYKNQHNKKPTKQSKTTKQKTA